MYAFHLFRTMDSFLLAMMAIDRFVAIVHPLHYSVIMSPCVCGLLVGGPWLITNLQSLVHTSLMAQLTFCSGSEIPHFFCDLMPLLKLSCSDMHTNELVVFAFGIVMGISPLSCIHLHFLGSLQDPFCSGQVESLLHLWLAPHHGVTVLWHHLGHVLCSPHLPLPPRRTRRLP